MAPSSVACVSSLRGYTCLRRRRSRGAFSACLWLLTGLVWAGVLSTSNAETDAVTNPPPVRIEFFFEAGCGNCDRVENEILPELDDRYPGDYRLERLDVWQLTNYLRLAGYQERLQSRENEDVSMMLDGRFFLNGFREIQTKIFDTMDALLATPVAVDSTAAPPPATMDELRARVRCFTPMSVMAAGLVDGINPCAMATLVFFMSSLALARIGGPRLLLAGGTFCIAGFLTYLAIGLGLLHVLRPLTSLAHAREAINAIMLVLLLCFATLSFRDAWLFRTQGDAHGMVLRLPRPLMLATHAIMRRGLKARHLALGGFLIGVAVTVLESVCTGQVYVPTLVLVLRSGAGAGTATGYLVLYNLLFILPLVIILGLTWQGLRTARLLAWSRRHVVVEKYLLGMLFLALAALLLIL
ncbi:MAG: hypothetical protein PHW60_05505 [Kiritimatiellae bacterium]|nr:hypothetical protein [Kiritimatiellia bacterium]